LNNEKLMKKIAKRFSTTIIHHSSFIIHYSLFIIHFVGGIRVIQSLYKDFIIAEINE